MLLRKEFPAVLRRLGLLKDRSGFGIIFFFLLPARHSGIASFGQKELVRYGGRITFISGDILSAFCFFRVLAIVQTIPDGLSNRFAFARMALQQSCGSQKSSLLFMRKGRPIQTAPTSGQHGPKTEKAGHIHVLPNFCYSVSCCGQSGTVSSEVSITISSAGFNSSVKSCCRPALVTSILFTHIPIHGNCLLHSSIKSYISAVASLSSDM